MATANPVVFFDVTLGGESPIYILRVSRTKHLVTS